MEITIEFLTPAFLYGAFQTKPEFRIPSLLGQMRYWWRMTKDWRDVEKMREKEAKIFGLGEGGAKPFFVYLKQRNLKEKQAELQTRPAKQFFSENWLPEDFEKIKNQNGRISYDSTNEKLIYNGFMSESDFKDLARQFGPESKESIKKLYKKAHRYVFSNTQDGLSYLFYPFNQNKQELFSWLAPGSKVILNFEFLKENEEIRKDVLLSLFLAGRFGGLGSRSRRGGGSMKISALDCALFKLTETDLLNYVNGEKQSEYFSCIHEESPLWIALSHENRFKTGIRPEDDWKKTLGAVGSAMQGFRTKHKMLKFPGKVDPTFVEEAQKLHAYFNGNGDAPEELTKDAFGLPRIISFPPNFNALSVAPYIKKDENKKEDEMRRASPLHISVNRDRHGKYYCTFLVLWKKIGFLPSEMQIRLKKKSGGSNETYEYENLRSPGPQKLEEFLRRF